MSSTQPKARVNVKKPRLSYDQNALDLPALLQGGSETPTNTKLFKHGQNHPLPEHALPHQQKGQTEADPSVGFLANEKENTKENNVAKIKVVVCHSILHYLFCYSFISFLFSLGQEFFGDLGFWGLEN